MGGGGLAGGCFSDGVDVVALKGCGGGGCEGRGERAVDGIFDASIESLLCTAEERNKKKCFLKSVVWVI